MENIDIFPDGLLNDLNDFEIEEQFVAQGGFGKLQKGIIKSTGQPVVLKQPLTPQKSKQLIQEYNLLMKCSHPSIQTVVGFYHPADSTEYTLITPFYQNGSLDNLMKQRDFAKKKTLKYIIVLGIAAGMKYLHNIGIAHRDLKPGNILIDDNKRPILIDFGISRENIEAMSTLAGTYIYSAPEIFGNTPYNEKVDVYSFGLIVNEIYSGKIPFEDVSFNEMMKIKSDGTIKLEDSMPDFLKKLIEKCINPNQAYRPSFKEIFKVLKSKSNKIPNNSLISSYLNEIKIGSKIKRFFQIPKSIIKLPSRDAQWNLDSTNPIDLDVFQKIFNPDDGKKAILIMTYGNTQSGKSTFLRTITGNQAYFSGSGITTTTLGVLVDGPYKPNDIIDNIFDQDFRSKFEHINMDDTQIFFLDSQGIGDEDYSQNFSILLDRIHSIFCSISTVCISIPEINASIKNLQTIMKTMRRSQFMGAGKYTHLFLLVKGYEPFDKIEDIDFDSLLNFQNDFYKIYMNQYKQTSQYYVFKYLLPLPLGNCKSNYENYLYSVWYSFYCLLSKIDVKYLTPKKNTFCTLGMLSDVFFGECYSATYSGIFEKQKERVMEVEKYFSKSQDTTKEIIKCCLSCIYYLKDVICEILECSLNAEYDVKYLMNLITIMIYITTNYLLPYFLGNFDISITDYNEYSDEIRRDLNSYLKANSENWRKHMKLENNSVKLEKSVRITAAVVGAGICFIPIAGWILGPVLSWGTTGSYKLYWKIQEKIREKIKNDPFKASIFPFIWNRDMNKVSGKNYDTDIIKTIGDKYDQLIVFYEQNNNDSSLIFRALTGFDVSFSDKSYVSQKFLKVDIKSLMERFRRYGKIHLSKLQDPSIKNVNILYLKGCSQGKIISLCNTHAIKPIFVSSILKGQEITIRPEIDHILHLFYISPNIFSYLFVNRKSYVACMNDDIVTPIKDALHMERQWNILPITSKNYNFEDAGPVAHSLLKYGCRYVLQDKSFDKVG